MALNTAKLNNSLTAMTQWMRNGFKRHADRLGVLEENVRVGSFVMNQEEFNNTVNSAPSQADIFGSWYRFSHGSTQTFPFLPAETWDWALDPDGSIRNTFNSNSWIGVVSHTAYKQYALDVDVWSTNTDDDTIGLVVCFDRDNSTGLEYAITVARSPGGTGLYEVLYNPAQGPAGGSFRIHNGAPSVKWGNGQPGVMTKVEAGQGNNDPGWNAIAARRGGNANGKTRLRVVRKNDIITFQTSEWDSPDVLVPDSLLTLDLASNPKFERFRAGSRYGFAAYSQQDSYWHVREFSNPNDSIYRLDTNTAYTLTNGVWNPDPSIKVADLGTKLMLVNPYTKKAFYMEDPTQIVRMPSPI